MSETDSVYGDVIEQALYNTVLGGMNYEGNRFFYVNPLESVPEVCRDNTQRHHVKPNGRNGLHVHAVLLILHALSEDYGIIFIQLQKIG